MVSWEWGFTFSFLFFPFFPSACSVASKITEVLQYELWKCNNCRFCLRAFFVGQRYIPATETLGTASIEACHGVRLTTQKLALKWALTCRRDGKYSSHHLAWYLTTRRGSKFFLSRRCFGSRSLLLHCYIHCYIEKVVRERNLMEPLFLGYPIV